MLFKKKDKKISENIVGLKLGTSVEIAMLNDKEFMHSYHTKLIEILEDDEISILLPKSKVGIVKLPINKEYNIAFKTENGLLRSVIKTCEYFVDGKVPLIKCKLIEEVIKIQRRANFRLAVTLPMEFDIVEDTTTETLKNDDVLLSVGETVDISGGGVKFRSNENIEVRNYIKILVKTEDLFFVGIAVVIFKQEISEGYKYEYKCKFENIPKKFVEDISKYIFDKQKYLSKIGKISND